MDRQDGSPRPGAGSGPSLDPETLKERAWHAMGRREALAAFLFFHWCLSQGIPDVAAQNLLLLLMVIFENAHALNARSESRSVFRQPLATNPFLIVAILGAQALHVSTFYLPGADRVLGTAPVALVDWLIVVAVAISLILVSELNKWWMQSR